MDTSLYEKLLNASFRFVSYRPRSERETRDFLQKKLKAWRSAGQLSVDRVIARLREYGHIDDEKFAQWWVSQRQTFRPKGNKLIIMELMQKGISKEVAGRILLTMGKEIGGDELSGARKVIQKKLVLWAKFSKIEQKKKMYTFLAQRGFTQDTIQKIIDETVKKA